MPRGRRGVREGIGCGNGGVDWGWGVSGNLLRGLVVNLEKIKP